MTKEEYWERRNTVTENILFEVIKIIGIALPMTQDKIIPMLSSWDTVMEKLDKEISESESTVH